MDQFLLAGRRVQTVVSPPIGDPVQVGSQPGGHLGQIDVEQTVPIRPEDRAPEGLVEAREKGDVVSADIGVSNGHLVVKAVFGKAASRGLLAEIAVEKAVAIAVEPDEVAS